MKSKKLLLALAALTMSATTALAFTACGGNDDKGNGKDDNPPPAHTHTYGDWQITEPTRTENGSAVKVCADDATHTLTETLPNLNDGNYAIAKAADGFTFTYATENGDVSFVYKPFSVKVSADKFTYDNDGMCYVAEVSFTAIAAEGFTVDVKGTYEDLYIFDQEDYLNSYLNWEDDWEVVFSDSYATVAGDEYTLYLALTAEDASDVTFYFEEAPIMYEIAVLGENTAELGMYETACYKFVGEPDTEYTVECDAASVFINKLDFISNFEYDYSDDEGFTTDSNGRLVFMLRAYMEGEYTFEIAKAVSDGPDDPDDTCDHDYGAWEMVDMPTRLGEGSVKRVCSKDETHVQTLALPYLVSGMYTLTDKGNGNYTFTYHNDNTDSANYDLNGFFFNYKSPVFDLTSEDVEEVDGLYYTEISYTAKDASPINVTFNSDAEVSFLQIFESKEYYDNYMDFDNADYEDFAPFFNYDIFDDMNPNGLQTEVQFTPEAGKTYKFYVVADTDEFTVLFDRIIIPETVNGTGEKEVSLSSNEKAYLTFKGEEGTKYVLSFEGNYIADPEICKVDLVNRFVAAPYTTEDYKTSYRQGNRLVLTTNSLGEFTFCVTSGTAGTYTVKIEKYVAVQSTGIDLTGAVDNKFTINVHEELNLKNCITLTPWNTKQDEYKVTISDKTVLEGVVLAYLDSDKDKPLTYVLRGLKAGETTVTITAYDNPENTITFTVKVEDDIKTLNLGQNVFSYENDTTLPMQETTYQFTGDPNTKYVVTFEVGISYSYTIKDANDPNGNYLDRWNDTVTYIEVTTDADGKANLLILGNGTGTLTITLASEFEYPDEGSDSEQDNYGAWLVGLGDNNKITTDQEDEDNGYFIAVLHLQAAAGEYTMTLPSEVLTINAGLYNGDYFEFNYVGTGKTANITVGDGGEIFIQIISNTKFTDVTINFAVAEAGNSYETDAEGRIILNVGENAGLSVKASDMNTYFAFHGEDGTYTVTVSQVAFYVGQVITGTTDWMNEDNSQATFDLVVADGVAYIRYTSFSDVNGLTITITKK